MYNQINRILFLGALTISVLCFPAIEIHAQETELKEIHNILNTVEQKYKKYIKETPGNVSITIRYIQEVDNPEHNIFRDDLEGEHFPLPLFSSELDYSNPFPGFPNKPKNSYTLSISQQSITLKLQDHDIMLHGDLDKQGNDKIPANPFTRAWKCNGGSATLEGMIGLPNRKIVKVNMSNTCSHAHKALYRSMQGRGQKSNGKWVTTHGGTDYYPAHKFDHDQTTTYSIQSIMKEAGYSRDKFIYEMLCGGLYYIRTNKENGNLKLQEDDRLCTVYAIWKVFGMTDDKYRQIYKSLSSSANPESQRLDAQYKEAMSLYKAGQYQKAHELYSSLRDGYEKLSNSNVIQQDYKLYMSRAMSSTYRKVYSILKPKTHSREEMVAVLTDADSMLVKYNTVFSGIPDFYKNCADLLIGQNENCLAWRCLYSAYDNYSKQGELTPEQECQQIDCLLATMELELELIINGTLQKEQHKTAKILTVDSFHQDYINRCSILKDRSKREFYKLRWYDVWAVTRCKQSMKDECKKYVDYLISHLDGDLERLKQFKCYKLVEAKYPDLLSEE